MKVTVCFGSVRVLVPCGAGDLLVRDLVREATLRYKKATGQAALRQLTRVDMVHGTRLHRGAKLPV
ncbi:unnamed protein product [Plutella xylostella]|uniref:(diamondback moth) hypothetical protein n=1 Tax=Plutella xylostella TaxID=51655 RepID=A0A8S4DIA7_PLUXY|nr:unnamed protein product [Plutella xylostella]